MDEAFGRNLELGADGVDAFEQVVLHDQGPRVAMLHDVVDLRTGEAEVDRHCDQSGPREPDIELQPLDAVVGQECDAVTLPEAEPVQGVGQPGRALMPLGETQRAL
jgi:hypothetical protein